MKKGLLFIILLTIKSYAYIPEEEVVENVDFYKVERAPIRKRGDKITKIVKQKDKTTGLVEYDEKFLESTFSQNNVRVFDYVNNILDVNVDYETRYNIPKLQIDNLGKQNTSILLDGIKIQTAGFSQNLIDVNSLPMGLVDGISIEKGQSAVLGGNASAGSIDFHFGNRLRKNQKNTSLTFVGGASNNNFYQASALVFDGSGNNDNVFAVTGFFGDDLASANSSYYEKDQQGMGSIFVKIAKDYETSYNEILMLVSHTGKGLDQYMASSIYDSENDFKQDFVFITEKNVVQFESFLKVENILSFEFNNTVSGYNINKDHYDEFDTKELGNYRDMSLQYQGSTQTRVSKNFSTTVNYNLSFGQARVISDDTTESTGSTEEIPSVRYHDYFNVVNASFGVSNFLTIDKNSKFVFDYLGSYRSIVTTRNKSFTENLNNTDVQTNVMDFGYFHTKRYASSNVSFYARADVGFNRPDLYMLYDRTYGNKNLITERVRNYVAGIDIDLYYMKMRFEYFISKTDDPIYLDDAYTNGYQLDTSGLLFKIEHKFTSNYNYGVVTRLYNLDFVVGEDPIRTPITYSGAVDVQSYISYLYRKDTRINANIGFSTLKPSFIYFTTVPTGFYADVSAQHTLKSGMIIYVKLHNLTNNTEYLGPNRYVPKRYIYVGLMKSVGGE